MLLTNKKLRWYGDFSKLVSANKWVPSTEKLEWFGGLRCQERIGGGSFSEVYRLSGIDSDYALKILKECKKPETEKRFQNEIEALDLCRGHPNVMGIEAYGEFRRCFSYLMPFVKGVSLDVEIGKQLTLPEFRALGLCERIGRAVEHVHGKGLIHRDIKPDNVLIKAKTRMPILSDFGFAIPIDSEDNVPSEKVFGTPNYMSPEHVRGCELDFRSDIYSFGVLMFEIMTGRLPFDSEKTKKVLSAQVEKEPPSPRKVNPCVSEGAERIILRALKKNPDDRYQTMSDMLWYIRAEMDRKGFYYGDS